MADILILSVEKRKESALKVQEILTKTGCAIKTRLGLHGAAGNKCGDAGIIILELDSPENEINVLASELAGVGGVKVKYVNI